MKQQTDLMGLYEIKRNLDKGKSIYDLPLRVCFYARVSTDKDEQLNSLDNQVGYFENFINENINWEYAGQYIDEGISGKSVEKRASFLKMIDDAKQNKFDLIITKEISRFSRNTLDSIKYTQELLNYGVGVFFQSDNINTLYPDSELRLTIMASIAQEEVRKLSERLRFGYKRSIEKGRVLGQNNIYGYHKADGKLTIVEEEAAVIRKIFNMYIEGKFGVRRIARELEKQGIVSPNTGKMFGSDSIKQFILNPKYKGFYCSGKTISIDYKQNKRIRQDESEWNVYKDDAIPAIVSEEVWNKANAIYKQRGEKSKGNEQAYINRYIFSGKLTCADHGTSYHRHIYKSKKRGEQEVWNCKLYRQKGKIDGCDSPTIYTTELQEILNNVYKTIYDGKDTAINGLIKLYSNENSPEISYDDEINNNNSKIAKLKQKKEQILDLVLENLLPRQDFKSQNDRLNSGIEKLEQENQKLQSNLGKAQKTGEYVRELQKTLKKEFDNPDNFNAELNNALLNKIIVHKIDGNKKHIKLEILLNIGNSYIIEPSSKDFFSLDEIGISQAQVSRLEKNALKNMKKYIS